MKRILISVLSSVVLMFTAISTYLIYHNYNHSLETNRFYLNPASEEAEKDPNRFIAPVAFAKQAELLENIPDRANTNSDEEFFSNPEWVLAGPNNVGGRTRAMKFDVMNENIFMAGGVSGGLWRSTNKGNDWEKVTAPKQNQFITALAQDERTGKTNIWYLGTGERNGSASSIGTGDGIYKSTDNGMTWNRLESTAFDDPQDEGNGFNWCWNLLVNKNNPYQDEIWVAANGFIYRSLDGGNNWEVIFDGSLKSSDSDSYYAVSTDIAITSKNIMYATISKPFGGNTDVQGIWRCDDAGNWTNITPTQWHTDFERIVIEINPANEDEVYFFVSVIREDRSCYLYRYTYLSGDGTAEGGQWENLSNVFDNYVNPQRGYNMVVAVNPVNPEIVLLGAQSFHETQDAFATSINMVTGIHPDHHDIIFSASDPNQLYVGNDGGIYTSTLTDMQNESWTTLNNGYITSQFYCVGIDHATSGSKKIIGGTQDNGSWITTTASSDIPWNYAGFGDVVDCAISNGGEYCYQYGMFGIGLLQHKIMPDGTIANEVRIQPENTTSYSKMFELDPSNSNIMYFATMNNEDFSSALPHSIYINSKLNEEYLNDNWSIISGTKVDNLINGLAVSWNNPSHRLYYGRAGKSILNRVDNANSSNPIVNELPGPNIEFSSSAPYNSLSIAVDPNNGDNVLISFMGFSQKSIFYSSDAGNSWTHVSGNLEENPDGSGNGPAIRTIAILPLKENRNLYLAGGSMGLFSTTELAGEATVWMQEGGETIGYLPVYDIDVRPSDYFVVVATHGNGVFTSTIDPNILGIEREDELNNEFTLYQNYPNPFNNSTKIIYNLPQTGHAELIVYNSIGEIVRTLVDKEQTFGIHEVAFNGEDLPSGIYIYKIKYGEHAEYRKMIYLK
ncbi:MAG: T9SS type A sorting domain-containing protein [Bacteroidetes bacterium]|nr:T9SS type A sorting domain-containing protein [Bacteroidota bacterium]